MFWKVALILPGRPGHCMTKSGAGGERLNRVMAICIEEAGTEGVITLQVSDRDFKGGRHG